MKFQLYQPIARKVPKSPNKIMRVNTPNNSTKLSDKIRKFIIGR